jgi:hypothetical protein
MSKENKIKSERLSLAQKRANDNRWYKEKIDEIQKGHYSLYEGTAEGSSEYKRMKVNYDLFNNILDLDDFAHVCIHQGNDSVGEMPAQMVNRDISSGKIKAVLGMEKRRPFNYRWLASNPEATTRIEQEAYARFKQYVIDLTMLPIRQEAEIKYQEELSNTELAEEQKKAIMDQMKAEIDKNTPDKIKDYMARDHEDVAEVMVQQLLNHLIKKTDAERKFLKGMQHMQLSAKEVYYIGVHNGHPELWNVNSLRFNCDRSPDLEFIEDGDWATQEYRMTPSQVISYFGRELKPKQIDQIYQMAGKAANNYIRDNLFTFNEYDNDHQGDHVKVVHCVWKALRPIKFLTYFSSDGTRKEKIVDESYKLDIEAGDISLESEWIPEVYEGWKIMDEFYVGMGPMEGQFKDMDNIWKSKLPYYGAICDDLNSAPTCLMDRLKVYQYYYNIVMYRLELILASDKGKKILMNINAIPDSDRMGIKEWQYFLDSSPFIYFNPDEEGSSVDASSIAKEIDLSLVSDIGKYIEIAQFLERKAADSIGFNPAVEGHSSPYESVANNKTNIQASSNILEPLFDLHSLIKRNVLVGLVEKAKVAYSNSDSMTLTHAMDDLSREILKLDMALLDTSTLDLYLEETGEASEIKQTLKELSFAAMQNQKIELSDVISVLKQKGIAESEETLKAAEENRHKQALELEAKRGEQAKELQAAQERAKVEEHEREKELIVLKEEERRKTEVIKASFIGASFNPDQDANNNNENDFIELAKDELNATMMIDKNKLEREKFEHQKIQDAKKMDLENKKLKAANAKNAEGGKKSL